MPMAILECSSFESFMENAKENCADWLRHGTDKRGDKHPLARLSQDDVVQIKALRAAGSMYKVIGRKFSIHPIHARNIVIGKRWKHANA